MDAVDRLRNAIERNDPGGQLFPKPNRFHEIDYAVWRFLHAWHSRPEFGPDQATLLRQALRWYGGDFYVNSLPFEGHESLRKAGIRYSPMGYLAATPFRPEWLKEQASETYPAIDEKPEQRCLSEGVLAESYLRSLTYKAWQCQAQKEGAWTALTAPPSSTTLIALPTGAGKSLCSQILSRFGSG